MNSARAFLLLLAAGLWPASAVAELPMESLTDEAMEEVSAQQGIALNLEFRINAKADGQPVDSSECPTVGALTGGASCRVALALPDLAGAWIVLKGFRGLNKLNNIRLDATTFGGNSVYRDLATYMGGYDPNNKPAIQLTAGNWATALAAGASAYNTYLNTGTYQDFTTALSIERLSVEFDSGAVPGYLRDAIPGAPLSMRLAHGNGLVPDPNNPPDVMFGPYTNDPARIRLDGRLQVHGFGVGF